MLCADLTTTTTQGEPMARTSRTAGINKTVRRTVKKASTRARRATEGNDLIKAVQGLVKALPVSELEKRLAGLEKSVAKLEGEIRKAAQKVGTAVRTGKPAGARRGAKRATAKRTGVKKATTRRATKRVATKRTSAKRTTAKRTTAKRTSAPRKTATRRTRSAAPADSGSES
jgi:hypothetical protein